MSFRVERLSTRRCCASEPSALSFVGDTSVTVPPPAADRENEPIAMTLGSDLPLLVRPVKVTVPGVQA